LEKAEMMLVYVLYSFVKYIKMLHVSVYFGGEIVHGRFGAEYGIGPRLIFSINESTIYDELIKYLLSQSLRVYIVEG
jgi:hypothetical protein